MCELWLLRGKLSTRGVKRGVSQKTGSGSGLFVFHFKVWVETDTLLSGPFFSLGVDTRARTHTLTPLPTNPSQMHDYKHRNRKQTVGGCS